VLAAEAFEKLLNVILRARQGTPGMAVVLKGNPEYLQSDALRRVADRVLDEAVRRLTTGDGDVGQLIS